MAELTMLGRCPTCGQNRVKAAVCQCGHYVYKHALDPHRYTRTFCFHTDETMPSGCGCREYVEAVADG